MRIVAPKAIRNKVILSAVLGVIFASLALGYHWIGRSAVNTMVDSRGFDTVVIDAGHGGFDGGASAADGTPEKNINLRIAMFLQENLETMGIHTVMTRSEDTGTQDADASGVREMKRSDLRNRLAMLTETPGRMLVSIHQNFFTEPKYHGAQIFYSGNHPESVRLAESIRAALIPNLQPENHRELKKTGSEIYLLHQATVPAVMVECGFLSNPEEAKLLKSEVYQKKLALLIALGIYNYLKSEAGSEWHQNQSPSMSAAPVATKPQNGTAAAQAAANGIHWKKQ